MGEHRLNPPASCHPHRRPVRRLFPTGRAAPLRLFRSPRVLSFLARVRACFPLSFTPQQRGNQQRNRLLVVPQPANHRPGTARPMRRRLPLLHPVVSVLIPQWTRLCRHGIKKFLLGLNHPPTSSPASATRSLTSPLLSNPLLSSLLYSLLFPLSLHSSLHLSPLFPLSLNFASTISFRFSFAFFASLLVSPSRPPACPFFAFVRVSVRLLGSPPFRRFRNPKPEQRLSQAARIMSLN